MLSSAVRFTDNAAGVEKSLRLFQGFCTIAAGMSVEAQDAAAWGRARSELALGRRYLRILKWHPSWSSAYRALNGNQASLPKTLEVAKLSFLGLYYFLEMPTITNTMKATNFGWGHVLQAEANKCWVYAIVFSILLSLYQLYESFTSFPAAEHFPKEVSTTQEDEKATEPAKPAKLAPVQYTDLCRQLLVDGCDLIIATSAAGWLTADEMNVGIAYVISSSVAGTQLWSKIQASAT